MSNFDDELKAIAEGLAADLSNLHQAAAKELKSITLDTDEELAKDQQYNIEKEAASIERKQLENQAIAINTELKAKYARETFVFMCVFILLSFFIILIPTFTPFFLKLFGCKDYIEYLKFEAIPSKQIIYIIPASMGLFGWVLKGLFSKK